MSDPITGTLPTSHGSHEAAAVPDPSNLPRCEAAAAGLAKAQPTEGKRGWVAAGASAGEARAGTPPLPSEERERRSCPPWSGRERRARAGNGGLGWERAKVFRGVWGP